MGTKLSEALVSKVSADGWLSISSLFFDNSYYRLILDSDGYIAASPTKELICMFTPLDSTNNVNVEGNLVRVENCGFNTQFLQNVTAFSFDELQHFSIAMYAQDEIIDSGESILVPNILTKAEIQAIPDPDQVTGLYAGYTTWTNQVTTKQSSTFSIYNRTTGSPIHVGGVIDNWKHFYRNQDRFIALMNTMFTATDFV